MCIFCTNGDGGSFCGFVFSKPNTDSRIFTIQLEVKGPVQSYARRRGMFLISCYFNQIWDGDFSVKDQTRSRAIYTSVRTETGECTVSRAKYTEVKGKINM